MEWTPNESQHTKLTLEKKFLLPFLLGFKLTTFQSQVQRFANKLSWPHTFGHSPYCLPGGWDAGDWPRHQVSTLIT